ncbi:uncharacterized protein LOC143363433 [Halictus rubicundus]|uniref:uncharacterized protein LOC143363433 n=1 Tax=Halictus rubicundus TaxID=77578 RepID=UPI0040373022
MDNEKLIEMVRQFRILYDLSHPKYSDSKVKEKVWCEIAEQMKESEAACKKTWANLRESYRRSLKRRRSTRSGQAAGTIRKWRYEEEMAFLDPLYNERPTITSVSVNIEDTDDTILDRDNCETVDTATASTSASDSPTCNMAPQSVPLRDSPVPRRKKRVEEKQTAAAAVMNYLLQNKEKNQVDDVDRFCLSISSTIKKFSPYNLAMAKKQIFDLVSELEFRDLNGKSYLVCDDQMHYTNL